MLSIKNQFTVRSTLEHAWDLFSRFEDLARLIPTVQEIRAQGDELLGRVSVKLGKLPVSSRLKLRIVEQKPLACIKAVGASYLGETLRDQVDRGKAREVDRNAVGHLSLHLDLRSTEDPSRIEITYTAEVEAEGRLRRIYESILATRAPALMQEFAENIKRTLEGENGAGAAGPPAGEAAAAPPPEAVRRPGAIERVVGRIARIVRWVRSRIGAVVLRPLPPGEGGSRQGREPGEGEGRPSKGDGTGNEGKGSP